MTAPNDPKAAGKVFDPTPARQVQPQRGQPNAGPAEAARSDAGGTSGPVHKFGAVPVNAAPGAGTGGLTQTLDRFGFDSDALTAGHLKAIDALAASIAGQLRQSGAGATVAITLTGHTDTSGTEAYNQGLGQRRADHVRAALDAALRKAGVAPSQIAGDVAVSAGEGQPKVPTKDEVREPRNRRVEVAATVSGPKAEPQFDPLPDDAPKGLAGVPDLFKMRPPGIPPVTTPMPNPRIPNIPRPSQEWLENYFKSDPLLHQLPKGIRDKLLSPLKDLDELAADKVIDALPIPHKDAVKAAVKALLETLKGRKFTMPVPPPVQPDFPPEHAPQHMPGEVILQTPKIPLPKPFN